MQCLHVASHILASVHTVSDQHGIRTPQHSSIASSLPVSAPPSILLVYFPLNTPRDARILLSLRGARLRGAVAQGALRLLRRRRRGGHHRVHGRCDPDQRLAAMALACVRLQAAYSRRPVPLAGLPRRLSVRVAAAALGSRFSIIANALFIHDPARRSSDSRVTYPSLRRPLRRFLARIARYLYVWKVPHLRLVFSIYPLYVLVSSRPVVHRVYQSLRVPIKCICVGHQC
ncbi:hypothetical protein VTO73DRAFT_2307 [Trametes versicolor]